MPPLPVVPICNDALLLLRVNELMAVPPAPAFDEETAEQVRELLAKGAVGTVFLTTDDCQASYEELKARGVEFTETPEDRPYGIDAGFRDPSGNNFRLTQVKDLR